MKEELTEVYKATNALIEKTQVAFRAALKSGNEFAEHSIYELTLDVDKISQQVNRLLSAANNSRP